MLIDSHCHLNFIDLSAFEGDLSQVLSLAKANDVGHFLSVCVELSDYPTLEKIAKMHENISISIGVHPNSENIAEVDANMLVNLAKNPDCIAIGETGLDYYREKDSSIQELQRTKFREHIRAALLSKKPLIIHTREAAEDTLRIMEEESADEIGGVMHCFAEDLDVANKAMAMNFYISFSGIVTFKSATTLQDVAKKIPLDKVLIETDSPYLAPVPYRGKQNHPALVRYVANAIADIRGVDYATIAKATTENFYRCFNVGAVA